MSRADDRIEALAGRVADGEAIDWSETQSGMTDAAESDLVEQLRVIERLATLNRSLIDGTLEEPGEHRRWAHLTLLDKVGAGTFGEVYHAWDPNLHRDVALKLLYPAASATAVGRETMREARLLARVRHANVAAVHGADHVDGRVGFWMEFIHGDTLAAVLERFGPLSPSESAAIGVVLCRALAAVHQAGVIHGDVKAANVMRERGGRIVLMDFGAGSETAVSSDGLARAGTPMYLAPEVLRERRASVRSDLYSLGVLLYHLVTCTYPVNGKTAAEVVDAHDRGLRRLLADARPDAPEAFQRVVERALAVDPKGRFASAGEMGRALETMSPQVDRTRRVAAQRRAMTWLLPVAVAAAAIGGWTVHRPATLLPSFQRLTFQAGRVTGARFAPDQQTIVYAAAWRQGPPDLFLTTPGANEHRALGLPGASLLSISSGGTMALLEKRHFAGGYVDVGTLATASLAGGSPRELLEGAERAEWAPDGATLAITREIGGRARLEFPIHTVLYESPGWLDSPRFTSDGRFIAVIDHPVRNDDSGAVVLVDLQDSNHAAQVASGGWVSLHGLAWNAAANEFWFDGVRSGLARGIQAVDVHGRARTIAQLPKPVTVRDISRDGRVLFTIDTERAGISAAHESGGERDVSWLDWSLARDLSEDGRFLLFNESGEAGGEHYDVYLRPTDGGDAVRLGTGSSLALAPDGRRALVRTGSPAQLALLPVGPGEPVPLPRADLIYEPWGAWFPDNRRVVFVAARHGHGTQLFLQRVAGGLPDCLTPGSEGITLTSPHAVAPDGSRVIAVGADGRPVLVTNAATAPQPIAALRAGDVPVRWTADARGVLVYRRGAMPLRVMRVDLTTGERTTVRELQPEDPSSVVDVIRMLATADGRTFAYSYTRELSELFVADHLPTR